MDFTITDDDLDSIISSIQMEPKKQSSGSADNSFKAPTELSIDDIDAFMADLSHGGSAARAQATKKPVIKRKSKYTAPGAATGSDLDSMLENLDSKNEDFSKTAVGVCAKCNGYILGEMITIVGKTFHPNHVSCEVCGRVDPKNSYFESNGKAVCYSCQGKTSGANCRGCGKPILTVSVPALGGTFHPECFTCSKCRKVISGNYAEREGKAVCSDCASVIRTCRSCNKSIEDKAISALGGFFHASPNCYGCQTCHTPVGAGFCNHNGLPYCEKHFLAIMGIATCAKCSKPITGEQVTAGTNFYHPDHFTCIMCNRQLAHVPYHEINGTHYCGGCYNLTSSIK